MLLDFLLPFLLGDRYSDRQRLGYSTENFTEETRVWGGFCTRAFIFLVRSGRCS